MAGEFKIKTGLLLGSAPSQIVTSITDSSSFINDSSTLASVKAIKGYADTKLSLSGGNINGDVSFGTGGKIYSKEINSLEGNNFIKTDVDISINPGINYNNSLVLGSIENSIVISSPKDLALSPDGNIYMSSDVSIYSPLHYIRHFNSPGILDIPDVSYLNWKIDSCVGQNLNMSIAASDEFTSLEASTGITTFRVPFSMKLTDVRASLTTPPSGSSLVVDINKNGNSILSTKISIDSGEKTSYTSSILPVISDSSINDDDEISIDLDQIGVSTAGSGLKIYLLGNKL